MKKTIAIAICSLPFALTPLAYAQTGTTTGAGAASSGASTSNAKKDSANTSKATDPDRMSANSSSGASANRSADGTSSTESTQSNTNRTGNNPGDGGASGPQSHTTRADEGAAGSHTSGQNPASNNEGTAPNTKGPSNQSQSSTGATHSGTSNTGAGAAAGSAAAGSSSGSHAMSSGAARNNMADVESVKEQLLGKSVYNENNDKIGDVNDVVLDQNNKATEVVVGVGGFIGMGERKVAVPFDRISKSTDGDKLILAGYTKDQLKEMPEYKAPDTRQADTANRGDIRPAPATGGMGTPGAPSTGPSTR